MGRKTSYYKQALNLLEELHQLYPQYEIGRHIATAFADYGDIWGISGKEFLFALHKYKAELGMDNNNIASEDYVNQIVQDGMNLGMQKDSEDEEEEEEWE